MSQSGGALERIFEDHIRTLALTLRRDTVTNYRSVARRFLGYLHSAFPQVRRLAQLRRDPHLLGWFRWMCEQDPPLCNKTRADYLLGLRRLLDSDRQWPLHPAGPHPPRGLPATAPVSA
jgi:hypothetical protein